MTTYTVKEYAAHLATAGRRLDPLVTRTVNRAAREIKGEWRRLAAIKNPASSASAKYPSTIVERAGKVEDGTYTKVVETMDRGQGKLGAILEYGGPHNAPQRSNVAAMAKEAPNLATWLARDAKDALT